MFYALAAYNCFRILGQRLTSGATIAWIFINLGLPVIGVPLYFLLGNQRIQGYVRRHRARAAKLAAVGAEGPRVPQADELPEACRTTYSTFHKIFAHLGPHFAPARAQVQLLIDGTSTFKAIFQSITQARRYILVQYYILRSDRLGIELKRLLIDKAKSGVPVFLLYDDMGSFWLSTQYIQDLLAAGVRIARFLPVTSIKRFFQVNFRNHRKLVVVDGEIAFTGGLNVGEEYVGGRVFRSSQRSTSYWRDTHLQLIGDAVMHLEDSFFEDWYFATDERLDAHPAVKRRLLPSDTCPPSQGAPVVQVVSTGPTDPVVIPLLYLMQMFSSAQQRIWIATPYFIPDPTLMRAIELAVLRGIEVRIMLPKTGDNRLVHWVSLSFAEQARAAGALIHLYEAGYMHQKVIVVDEALAAVGTLNIDNRALYLNFETMILVHDQAFAQRLADTLRQDFLHCRYPKTLKNRAIAYMHRIRANAARLAAPLM